MYLLASERKLMFNVIRIGHNFSPYVFVPGPALSAEDVGISPVKHRTVESVIINRTTSVPTLIPHATICSEKQIISNTFM